MTWSETDDAVERVLTPAEREAFRACRAPGSMPVREYARTTDRSPGTISNLLRRAEEKLTAALDEFAMPLDFLTERDDHTTSWQRAAPLDPETCIESVGRYGWRVELPDGDPHLVALARERGGYFGRCDCKGYAYRDQDTSPCAHLCTLRQAAFIDVEDADGDRVRIPETEADTDATPEQAVADGGRRVVDRVPAGTDGREFGRPEGQL